MIVQIILLKLGGDNISCNKIDNIFLSKKYNCYKEVIMKIGIILENEYTSDSRIRKEAEFLAANGFKVNVLAFRI